MSKFKSLLSGNARPAKKAPSRQAAAAQVKPTQTKALPPRRDTDAHNPAIIVEPQVNNPAPRHATQLENDLAALKPQHTPEPTAGFFKDAFKGLETGPAIPAIEPTTPTQSADYAAATPIATTYTGQRIACKPTPQAEPTAEWQLIPCVGIKYPSPPGKKICAELRAAGFTWNGSIWTGPAANLPARYQPINNLRAIR